MSFATSQDEFARALLSPGSAEPAGVVTARGGQDPARFAVYRNNVFVGLTRALAQRFPVTERLVGTDFFLGMARTYAGQRKPASPLMFAYGDDFPDFIAGFAPAAGVPYLGDVARLEAAWSKAYHAADADALTVADLAQVAPEALALLRLVAHPAARLVRSAYPVGGIWAAHQATEVRPVTERVAQTVLVVRPQAEVCVHVLPPADTAFAGALLDGATLSVAAALGAADPGFEFGTALVGLVSLGAFRAAPDGGLLP
jgi:hypothetical protein